MTNASSLLEVNNDTIQTVGDEEKAEEKKEDENKRLQEDFVYDNHQGRMEVVSILAHELGHWANMDTIKMTAYNLIKIYILFFAFGWVFKYIDMTSSFGFNSQIIDVEGTKGKSIFLSLTLFFMLIEPINWVLGAW